MFTWQQCVKKEKKNQFFCVQFDKVIKWLTWRTWVKELHYTCVLAHACRLNTKYDNLLFWHSCKNSNDIIYKSLHFKTVFISLSPQNTLANKFHKFYSSEYALLFKSLMSLRFWKVIYGFQGWIYFNNNKNII